MSSSAAAGGPSPVIRPALEADLPRVLALLERSALPTVGVAEAWSGFIVAENAGDIVGVVGVEACGDRYELLRSTAVADEWRRRGLGRTLVERAIAEARGRGVAALYLLTTTAETYFPSFGFSRVSREEVPAGVRATEEFSSACPASAAVMMLSLS
jgi:amino-acid N-acetyltransferase